jgi:hypothetical protein
LFVDLVPLAIDNRVSLEQRTLTLPESDASIGHWAKAELYAELYEFILLGRS